MDRVQQIGWRIKAAKFLFVAGCALLPWVDLFPGAVWLLMILGALLLSGGGRSLLRSFRGAGDPLLILFLLFYLLQLIAWLSHPADAGTRLSLEQKASLFCIPVLLSLYLEAVPQGWVGGVKGFLAGLLGAVLYCLASAISRYSIDHDQGDFFYHRYAAAVGANAIYFSAYLIAGMCLIVHYYRTKQLPLNFFQAGVLITFFYLNILILNSKTMIVIATILLLGTICLLFRGLASRLTGAALVAGLLILVSFTANPVKTRFDQLDSRNIHAVLTGDDFTNYPFNDLDLRLLLWRMGGELLNENKSWLLGLSGRAYHQPLNVKMQDYQLFQGNAGTGDTGYLNYNMHNQYMENLIQFGIVGLFVLMAIIIFGIYGSIKQANPLLLLLLCFFAIAFLSESLLETQSGILLFTIFIFGEWKRSRLAK